MDVVCLVSDCILEYIGEKSNKTFTVNDIWYSDYTVENVQQIFSKPNPTNKASNEYDKWFYYMWTEYHLEKFIAIAKDKATTMGHIKREELKKSLVLIPDEKSYNKISQLMKPIYDIIIKKRLENKILAKLRDTLLPKLMNGEIDVSDIKI